MTNMFFLLHCWSPLPDGWLVSLIPLLCIQLGGGVQNCIGNRYLGLSPPSRDIALFQNYTFQFIFVWPAFLFLSPFRLLF